MSHGGRSCRDCGAPIAFIQGRNDRWIPVVPGTEDRHRCALPQTCEDCQKEFQGANWMKVCPACYKSGGSGSNRSPGPARAPRPSHTPEPLREDLDDDAPPF